MPKTLVIKSEPGDTNSLKTARNMCKALAEAIKSNFEETQGTSGETKFSVSFGSIGYANLKFEISARANTSDNATFNLINSDANQQLTPIKCYVATNSTTPKNNSANCYVVRDNNNDTVLVGFHPGDGDRPSVTSSYDSASSRICIFIGKDVNDEIIWGTGRKHMEQITNGMAIIKTTDIAANYQQKNVNPETAGLPQNILQFVKMRNYLSAGFPEMKTAYVTMIRSVPSAYTDEVRANISYYSDGALWGYAGANSWGSCLFPIDPWVKY